MNGRRWIGGIRIPEDTENMAAKVARESERLARENPFAFERFVAGEWTRTYPLRLFKSPMHARQAAQFAGLRVEEEHMQDGPDAPPLGKTWRVVNTFAKP